MARKIVHVPDIGADEAEVIEIHVAVGDMVAEDQDVIVLESDKATVEVPSSHAGKITALSLKVGDKVSQGHAIFEIEADGDGEQAAEQSTQQAEVAIHDVKIPDIGSDSADVIEIPIAIGDEIDADSTIVILESDKATVEVPAPFAGKVVEIVTKVGDKLSEGHVAIKLEGVGEGVAKEQPSQPSQSSGVPTAPVSPPAAPMSSANVHAGPSVRRIAAELNVNLAQIRGTGAKGRITKDDLKAFLSGGVSGSALPPVPKVDFSKFGDTEEVELLKIQKISGKHLHACWVNVPHVTQFDEADITEMDAHRKANKAKAIEEGYKLTPLAYIVKAVAMALSEFPKFNASLSADGEKLILKKYCNVGIAVDTPNGLVVPVLKDADKKTVKDLAVEMGEVSLKAREGKLTPKDMQGGCFTISSLGGIGGTKFTPVVNLPEVGILGVSKSAMQPVYDGEQFVPRLMLPLSLSYDHRVIDGAEGARFIVHLSQLLGDVDGLIS